MPDGERMALTGVASESAVSRATSPTGLSISYRQPRRPRCSSTCLFFGIVTLRRQSVTFYVQTTVSQLVGCTQSRGGTVWRRTASGATRSRWWTRNPQAGSSVALDATAGLLRLRVRAVRGTQASQQEDGQ